LIKSKYQTDSISIVTELDKIMVDHHHASGDAILYHAHLTKHPVDRPATCERRIQREISPCPLRTFTRAEMRALRKRSLLDLAVEKKKRPQSPSKISAARLFTCH